MTPPCYSSRTLYVLLYPTVFLIHLPSYYITTTGSKHCTNHTTGCTVFLIDNGTCCTTGNTTNYGTFSGFTPSFFLSGCTTGCYCS